MDIYRLKKDDAFVAFEKEIKDPEKYPFPTPSGKIEIFSSRFDKLKNPVISRLRKGNLFISYPSYFERFLLIYSDVIFILFPYENLIVFLALEFIYK